MKKIVALSAIAIAFLMVALIPQADAKDSYKLRYGNHNSKLDYLMDETGTLNFHAENLPLPGATIDLRNIEMHTIMESWIECKRFDPELGYLEMIVMQQMPTVRMGYEFFQLPPLDIFLHDILMATGEEIPDIEDMAKPSAVTIKMTPRGKFLGMDMELPDEAGMQGQFVMGMYENYLKMITEPCFPEDAISVGDTWTQALLLDKIPFVKMPQMVCDYSLDGVRKDKNGMNIAKIGFNADWHWECTELDPFVVGETFEYFEDKEFEVVSVKPYFNLKFDGVYEHNIDGGFIVSGKSESEMILGVVIELKKLSGHNRGAIWSPRAEISMYLMDTIEQI
ncbi:hypothetical protein J7L05_06815 [bacterium]|nr:hypothetical protein [bacterium]